MADSFEAVRQEIARAIPQLKDEEMTVATDAFLGYIEIVDDVYDAVLEDPERSAAFAALTANLPRATFEKGQVEPINQEQSSPHA